MGNNKVRLLVVGLVLVLSLGYLLYTAFPGNAQYYMTVSEFMEDQTSLAGRNVRLAGKLEPGSHVSDTSSLDHSFTLEEGGHKIDASYTGLLPDVFENEHSEIVLEGSYHDGTFQAEAVVVKCPSKYQALVNEET